MLAFNLSCSSSSAVKGPAIQSFTAAAGTIAPGASTTLVGVFSGDSGSIDHGLGTVASGAAMTTGPLTETTTYTLTVKNWLGGSATATTKVTVAAPTQALTPVITAPASTPAGTSGLLASVPEQANCTFTWTLGSGGTITAGQGTRQITFTAGSAGTLTLGCVAQLANGTPSPAGLASVTVSAVTPPTVPQALTPVITAPGSTMAGTPGLLASVPAQADCTFTWTITGGTITAGQGTRELTFTAGTAGTLTLGCIAQLSTGTPSPAASASVTVSPVPQALTPVITAPASTFAGATGLLASVPAQEGATYAWTISKDGTITAGQGTRQITFDSTSWAGLTLGCAAQLSTGVPSAEGTATVAIEDIRLISFVSDAPGIYGGAGAALTATFTGGLGVVQPGNLPIISGTPITVKPIVNTVYTLKVTNGFGYNYESTLEVLVTPAPMVARQWHSATALQDGRVLFTGGYDANSGSQTLLASAGLYDPATGLTLPTGSMASPRVLHTATLLPSGKVLIVGGLGALPGSANPTAKVRSALIGLASDAVSSVELGTAELFDPATGTFTLCAGGLIQARSGHTATLVGGTVLIAGGGINDGGSPAFNTAESYDPATDTFTALSSQMVTGRSSHTATLLANGQVLLVGGYVSPNDSFTLASAESYDPATRAFTATLGSLAVTRVRHTATLLGDGTVLITGGYSDDNYLGKISIRTLFVAESYDPLTGLFQQVGSMNAGRDGHTATLLADGQVLIAGGHSGGRYLAASVAPALNSPDLGTSLPIIMTVPPTAPATYLELYNPATKTFQLSSNLSTARALHSATLLPQGRVLLAGGTNGVGLTLATSELFYPELPGATAVIPPPVLQCFNPLAAGSTYQASVRYAMPGDTYTWSFTNGTRLPLPTAPSSVVFLAGAVGPMEVICVVTTPAGTASAETRLALEVVAIAPLPKLDFTATPLILTQGQSTTLAWTVSEATTLILSSPNLYLPFPANLPGSYLATPPQTTTYALTAYSSVYGTSVTQEITVTVNFLPTTPAITAAQAVSTGMPNLAASTSEQVDCSFAWTITGGTFADGTTTATGPNVSYTAGAVGTLVLTCTATNLQGSVQQTVNVNVVALPTATFTASPAFLLPGQSSTLAWTSNGSRAELTGQLSVDPVGSVAVTPSVATTYLLTVYNAAGAYTNRSVTVRPASLLTERFDHTATTLASGLILFAGGKDGQYNELDSLETYNPVTGESLPVTAAMTSVRQLYGATLLPSGKVLLVGGFASGAPLASADVYDPATGAVAATTGAMSAKRAMPGVTLLPNGKVLITGGFAFDAGGQTVALASAEVFDPKSNTFSNVPLNMGSARFRHTATLLDSGLVLIAGGSTDMTTSIATAELYDPATNAFTATAHELYAVRSVHTATLLPSGKVLLAGGMGNYPELLTNAELYDPATEIFRVNTDLATTHPTGLSRGRIYASATLLPDGKVLCLGGENLAQLPIGSQEVFDPATGVFSTLAATFPWSHHTATLLPNGKVLLAGGRNGLMESVALFSAATPEDPAPGFPVCLYGQPIQVVDAGQPVSMAPLSPAAGLVWSISPDPAAAGLSFSATTGELSGTPVVPSQQRYRVTASNGPNASSCDLWLAVVSVPL